jgi:vacuolar-type H+-ATPase subunit I/STV1
MLGKHQHAIDSMAVTYYYLLIQNDNKELQMEQQTNQNNQQKTLDILTKVKNRVIDHLEQEDDPERKLKKAEEYRNHILSELDNLERTSGEALAETIEELRQQRVKLINDVKGDLFPDIRRLNQIINKAKSDLRDQTA